MSTGYQHQAPFDSGHLSVGEIHTIYYEQYGKQDGKPVLFLHGGPGGRTSMSNTQFFDPAVFRVLLFDQRGAGKSTPSAEIRENTSQHLVADIEMLRSHLGVSQWHLVFGGSWGSALALIYAQAHPNNVRSLILRGVLTGRKREFEFHRGSTGSAMLFPEAYDAFLAGVPEEDHADPVLGYYKLLQSSDPQVSRAAAKAFNTWDLWTTQLQATDKTWEKLNDDRWCLEHALIECHYFTHGLFVEEGELLRKENIDKIKEIPCIIIQGQYDICCAPQTAWDLQKQWPEAKLHMIPRAGHAVQEPGITEALVEACDNFAALSYE